MSSKYLAIALAALAIGVGGARAQTVKPEAITADGVPAIPRELADALRPYDETRAAAALDWSPRDHSLLVATRFGDTPQLHVVDRPMGERRQITFESDRVAIAGWAPSGDVLVAQKDVGGGEFYQLYTVADGRLSLITDGKSRNDFGAFSRDGRLLGYTSTRRDGADTDLYVVDPRDPKTDHMVAAVSGGWSFADFTPDGRGAIVEHFISVTRSVPIRSTFRLARRRRSPMRRPRSLATAQGRSGRDHLGAERQGLRRRTSRRAGPSES